MFRALGGEVAVQLVGSGAKVSGHRLGWRQRIGLGEERLEQPGRDAATLFLPERIALFADARLNRALYRWLAAWFAVVPVVAIDGDRSAAPRPGRAAPRPPDHARGAQRVSRPRRLCIASYAPRWPHARPQRSLPEVESEIEAVIRGLLGADAAPLGRAVARGDRRRRHCRPKRRRAISRSCPARCGATPWSATTPRRATTPKNELEAAAAPSAEAAPHAPPSASRATTIATSAIRWCSTASRRFWRWPR